MHRMKLHGMAAAFTESMTSTVAESMTPDGFLSWLLAREWDYRSAAAIGYQACKNGIRTLYANTSKLLGMLKVAKAKGTIEAELKKIERCQLASTSSTARRWSDKISASK